MPISTRERLVQAATWIISEESLSHLSIDHVTERAGLSRRTFFLHFSSKDELLAEVLRFLRPAHILRFRRFLAQSDGEVSPDERIYSLFKNLIQDMAEPKWRGCCFLRMSAEFGESPGHPVHAVVAEAHRDMERELESVLRKGGHPASALIARQLVVLINGLLVMRLVHRSSSHGAAVLCMLPDLLSRRSETEWPAAEPPMRAAE